MTKKTSKLAKNIMIIILGVYLLIPFISYIISTNGALKTIQQTASINSSNIEVAMGHLGSYTAIGQYMEEFFLQSNYNNDCWMVQQLNEFISTTNITFANKGNWAVYYIAYAVDGLILYILFYTITIIPTLIGGLIENEK